MRSLTTLPLLVLISAAAPLSATPGDRFETLPSDQLDNASLGQDVAFRDDLHARMTVPVSVRGSGPFDFLVDTAAERTAITRDLAAKLRLRASGVAAIHSITGVSNVATTDVPDLRFSSSERSVLDAPVLEARNIGADGILGTDSLRSQRVVFDFEKRKMTIVPSKVRAGAEPGTIIVTGRLRKGRLIVTDAEADGYRITVVVDTGSEISVGNAALQRRLSKRGRVTSRGPVELHSVTGGMLPGEFTTVEKLSIGKVGLERLAVVFADAHTFRQLGLEDRPALFLGMNALKAFRKVSIDFDNRKLRVLLPESRSIRVKQFADNAAVR